ncbi:MAG: hypothetical protein CMM56_06760 [Rhodospirillaceae bacterium]|nr:hypothetical protein [Rhodospirillaceae bacterium]
MALINCPGCKKKISEHASSCPSCGFAVSSCPECDAPKIKDIEVCGTCGYPYGNKEPHEAPMHKAPMHEEPVPSGLSGLLKGKLKTAGAYAGRGLSRLAYRKKEVGKFKNGMPHGQWKYFGTSPMDNQPGYSVYHGGYTRVEKPQLKLKGNWENGKAHGTWEWIGGTTYHNWDSGFVIRSRQYKYGLADGPEVSFDEYEHLKLKANWKDGRLHGLWEKFEQERG